MLAGLFRALTKARTSWCRAMLCAAIVASAGSV